MPMNDKLFKAILSMDSYNRGYNAGIVFGNNPGTNNYSFDTSGIQIGAATIFSNSSVLEKPDGSEKDEVIGFYGIAYTYNGGKVISYRGTDNFNPLPNDSDVTNGWLLGVGDYDAPQGWMAANFYNAVATQANNNNPIDPRLSNISTTGHSLGGGLASYISALYGKTSEAFDSMGYLTAANLAHVRATTLWMAAQEPIRSAINQQHPA